MEGRAELGGDKSFAEMGVEEGRAELGEEGVVELETAANVCELDGRAVLQVCGLGEKEVEILVSPVEEAEGLERGAGLVSPVEGVGLDLDESRVVVSPVSEVADVVDHGQVELGGFAGRG